MLEHSIGDLAIHFVTWILGGRNLLIHYKVAFATKLLSKGVDGSWYEYRYRGTTCTSMGC